MRFFSLIVALSLLAVSFAAPVPNPEPVAEALPEALPEASEVDTRGCGSSNDSSMSC